MSEKKIVTVGNIKLGRGNPFVLIAGPCVIEDEKHALVTAARIAEIAKKAGVPFIYKSSYDKANRTSIHSKRGPGLQRGIAILKKVKEECAVPVLSDVHSVSEIEKAAEVLDILQIPAFLCRQTDLLVAAADTGRIVNVKKGQFLAPWDMKYVIEKVSSRGNNNILLTERGTSFGYNNLVSDFRSLSIMKRFGYPVVYDATHSVQLPGGMNASSGGQSEFVPVLARAAAAVGIDALFIETHEDPEKSPSDGANMIQIDRLYNLLLSVKAFDSLTKKQTS